MEQLSAMLWNAPYTEPLLFCLGIWFLEWVWAGHERRARYDLPVLVNAEDIHLAPGDIHLAPGGFDLEPCGVDGGGE